MATTRYLRTRNPVPESSIHLSFANDDEQFVCVAIETLTELDENMRVTNTIQYPIVKDAQGHEVSAFELANQRQSGYVGWEPFD